MKFSFTIEGSYKVADEIYANHYGTTDPEKCAKIDEASANEDLAWLIDQIFIDESKVKITIKPANATTTT